MALLQKLKEKLGIGGGTSEREEGETTVTVERESDETIDEATIASEEATEEEPEDVDAEGETEDVDTEGETEDVDTEGETEDVVEKPDETDVEDDGDSVELIKGIGPAYGERLAAAGIETVDQLAAADPTEVAERTSVGEQRAATWIERANEF